MAGPLWLRVSLAALMIMIAVGYAGRLCVARASGTDGVHAAMGVAMAGMLVPGISLLPDPVWEMAFAASAGWFGWLLVRRSATRPPDSSPVGGSLAGGSLAGGSSARSSLARPAAVAAADATAVWPYPLLSGRQQGGPNCGRIGRAIPDAGLVSAVGSASAPSPASPAPLASSAPPAPPASPALPAPLASPAPPAPLALPASPASPAPLASPALAVSSAPPTSHVSAVSVDAPHDSPVPQLVECVGMVYMLAAAAGGLGPPAIAVLLGLCMVGAVVWRADVLARTAASGGLGQRLTVIGKIAMSATMGYMLFVMV